MFAAIRGAVPQSGERVERAGVVVVQMASRGANAGSAARSANNITTSPNGAEKLPYARAH
jgi:hypothetical protein